MLPDEVNELQYTTGECRSDLPEAVRDRFFQVTKLPEYEVQEWRTAKRVLPGVPKRMGTQLARTEELVAERKVHLQARVQEEAERLADDIVQSTREKLTLLQKELSSIRLEAAKLRQRERQAQADKRQQTLHSFFGQPRGPEARPRAQPEELGQGYTDRNISSKTFSHHVLEIEQHIGVLSKGDALKELQLAAAVNQRMQGIRTLRDKDQEAWSYVRNSLKAFFEQLQDKYNGRYPNHIRAAQQAVCAAIANAAPPRKLHVIAEAVGASVDRLSEGRNHWTEWMNGDRESLMDLRGKMRSDGMPDEWVEFAVDIWKANTRRSERSKDSVRNPNDR